MGAVNKEKMTKARKRSMDIEKSSKVGIAMLPRRPLVNSKAPLRRHAEQHSRKQQQQQVKKKRKQQHEGQFEESSSQNLTKHRLNTVPVEAPASPSAADASYSSSRAAAAAAASRSSSSRDEYRKEKGEAAAAAKKQEEKEKDALVAGLMSRQLLHRALKGITQYVLKRSSSSSEGGGSSVSKKPTPLLQEPGSETVSLMISLKHVPTHFKKTPILIELPHSLVAAAAAEVCLIVRDPQRKWKELLAAAAVKEELGKDVKGEDDEQEGNERRSTGGRREKQQLLLPHITRVIGVKKLKKKFPTYKDKRMLCGAYDVFLVDKRVVNQAYEALGKSFAQAKKLPLPVRLSSSQLLVSLRKMLHCTGLFLPRGPSLAVKIGRACMQQEKLEANACAALEELQRFFSDPGNKWRNTIHTVAVQATDAPALPLYTHPSYTYAAAAAVAAAAAASGAEKEEERRKSGGETKRGGKSKPGDQRKKSRRAIRGEGDAEEKQRERLGKRRRGEERGVKKTGEGKGGKRRTTSHDEEERRSKKRKEERRVNRKGGIVKQRSGGRSR